MLGTEATVAREYTHALIRNFGEGCDLTLVGSGRLAALAEASLAGEPVDDEAIRAEIAPCFVEDGAARTDTIVLACTHYPLLLESFERLAPWPVRWIDPAPAIARRVIELVGPATGERHGDLAPAIFTSGKTASRRICGCAAGLRAAAGVQAASALMRLQPEKAQRARSARMVRSRVQCCVRRARSACDPMPWFKAVSAQQRSS